jgi:hypothetical protein
MRRLAFPALVTAGGVAWAGAHWATHKAVAAEPLAHPHGPHGPAHGGTGYLTTSLTLCLALALVLAATATLESRRRTNRGRSLWLFGVVPVLGLLVEAFAAFPRTPAGIGSGLVELAPLALVSLVVQVAVALVALRIAHGILGLAEAVSRALVAPQGAADDGSRRLLPRGISERSPSSRRSHTGSQRAPPALQPAF